MPITEKITTLISELREDGFYKLYDNNKGSLIYHAPSNTTQPEDLIHDLYYKHTADAEHKHVNYVIASLPRISGFTFTPNAPRLKSYGLINKLNTYRSYTPISTSTECPLFMEMLERLLPDSAERAIFVQWLSHTIQRPAERPSFAVMLTSAEGTGKGVLFHQIINPLLSEQAVQCSNYNQFLGNHSTALSNSLFVMLDDTKSKSDSTITELKSKISEPEILVNPKYLQPYKQKVYARILLASNEVRPLKLSENDQRRWFVPKFIKHKVSKEETQQFYSKLIAWLATPNALDCIYNYLNEYDLTTFNPNYIAPTETLETMVSLSTSTKQEEVKQWVESKKVFKLEELTIHFNDCPDLAKTYALEYTTTKTADLLQDGKRSRWWVLKGLTVKQARDIATNPSGLTPF